MSPRANRLAARRRIDATCAAPGCAAPRDRPLILRLLVLLPALALAMKLAGFMRVYRALAWHAAARDVGRDQLEDRVRAGAGARTARHVADVVVHVNRHVLPYESRCLLESTALWYLLRRAGFGADLVLGARTLLVPFEAHAWVELDGEVLNDAANVRDIYEPFPLGAIDVKGTPAATA